MAFKDFINKKTSPYDDFGHGTHVTGIIAGNGTNSSGQYKGVAPEANLVGVKVLDETGSGRTSDVIAGIQWVVVAAAGNSGPAAGSINTPGINPHIITVGAADDRGTINMDDDVIAEFSSRGPTIDGLSKPDLVAPGVGITSLAAGTSYLPKKNSGLEGKPKAASQAESLGKPPKTTISDYYFTMSGTSMATPMVAGTAALILEQNPTWTPSKVKTQLMSTAMDLGFSPNEQGAGEVTI